MESFSEKYCIITYGCQMNLHESEKLAGILESFGYSATEVESDADIVVFNTCCIRENAEKKAEGNIGALKKLKRDKKNLIIAVGGCMTQQSGYAEKLVKKFPFIDIVFGTHNLENFAEMLVNLRESKKHVLSVLDKEGEIIEGTPKARSSYPNGWVNITYGCNNFCTYCIVPYVRGRERSRSMDEILKECKELISSGYKELTLLGQNVNSYGHDLGNVNFATLIKKVSEIEGDFRLRFMTNHPKDLTEEMVKAIAESDKTAKSIHLPVQAGSDRILKLMNRHYTRADYLDKIAMLRKYIPDIAITTDVMVGFPTETDEDFKDTVSLMKEVGFAGAFTFIYSPRTGTPAAKMDGQISEDISKARIMELIAMQNALNRKASRSYVGKTVEILCEGYDDKKKKFLGRDVYGRMAYFNGEDLIGKFVNVKITKAGGISLLGELVSIKA